MIPTGYFPAREAGPVTLAAAPAFQGITRSDCVLLTTMIAQAAPAWSAQDSHDYDGYRFVLIEPLDPMQNEPSFFVSARDGYIELTCLADETIVATNRFDTMSSLLGMLLQYLADWIKAEEPWKKSRVGTDKHLRTEKYARVQSSEDFKAP